MDHDLGMASEAGLKRPQMASMLPNDARNGWILAKFEVMASEVIVWPLDDLGGRPQAASDDLKRPLMT